MILSTPIFGAALRMNRVGRFRILPATIRHFKLPGTPKSQAQSTGAALNSLG